jgi:lysophospholipase L1-like esterase
VRLRLFVVLAAGASLLPFLASAQKPAKTASPDNWISTWATAQQVAPSSFGFPGGRGGQAAQGPNAAPTGRGMGPAPTQAASAPGPNTAAPQVGRGAPGQTPQGANPGGAPGPQGGRSGQGMPGGRRNPNMSNLPATLADQTIRMPLRISVGGSRVRIEVSNMTGAQALEIGAAHVGVYKGNGAIAAGSGRALTFSGNPGITVPPGALVVSDPVNLTVTPMSDVAVSLYLPRDTGAPTNHTVGLHTAYISKGNVVGSETMPEPATTTAYAWLSSVDVAAPAGAFTVVALGDSITDGYSTTPDADMAWPTLLAKRFSANRLTANIAVVNQGISGNQVLRDGAGISALARFDRDVLSRPGVKWVILLEGINDISIRGRSDGPTALTAEELIAGYRQIIDRCHMHGIKVMGATLTPYEGIPTASERGEGIRQAANKWIREKGHFDAVVDLDAALWDPQKTTRVKQDYDAGDHIHPNDAGNQAMANAFDLSLFRK